MTKVNVRRSAKKTVKASYKTYKAASRRTAQWTTFKPMTGDIGTLILFDREVPRHDCVK